MLGGSGMLFAQIGVSDAVWLALIGVLAMAVKEYFDRQRAKDAAQKVAEVAEKQVTATKKVEEAAEQAKEAGTKVDAVASETKKKLNEMSEVEDKIHILVNNSMGIQLAENAALADYNLVLAKLVRPQDNELIEKAERRAVDAAEKYREHMSKQATVDAKEKQS